MIEITKKQFGKVLNKLPNPATQIPNERFLVPLFPEPVYTKEEAENTRPTEPLCLKFFVVEKLIAPTWEDQMNGRLFRPYLRSMWVSGQDFCVKSDNEWTPDLIVELEAVVIG